MVDYEELTIKCKVQVPRRTREFPLSVNSGKEMRNRTSEAKKKSSSSAKFSLVFSLNTAETLWVS